MKQIRILLIMAAVIGLSGVTASGCWVRARRGHVRVRVATPYYTPMYYNGYIVYYDAAGLPVYYAGGVRYYVPRGHPRFQAYIGYYRRHGMAYRRWYRARGLRLRRRGYRRRGWRRRGHGRRYRRGRGRRGRGHRRGWRRR